MMWTEDCMADLDLVFAEAQQRAEVAGHDVPVIIEGRHRGVYGDQGDTMIVHVRVSDVPDPDVTYIVDGVSWCLLEIDGGGPETGAWELVLTRGRRKI